MNQVLATRKMELRRDFRERRKELTPVERAALGERVSANLLDVLEQERITCSGARIAIYLANAGEANLDALIEPLQALGAEVLAPHFEDEACPFYSVAPGGGNIAETAFGKLRLRTPRTYSGGVARAATELDAIVVPGLAFDRKGNRLGQGGGWYDRVLAEASRALKIGAGFDFQLVENLPWESHDQRMDFVVTEKRTIDTRS